tara:strand:+ start:4873 stop:6030 length:1158 start_codon:yes stop_codon:yes gene_type:complete
MSTFNPFFMPGQNSSPGFSPAFAGPTNSTASFPLDGNFSVNQGRGTRQGIRSDLTGQLYSDLKSLNFFEGTMGQMSGINLPDIFQQEMDSRQRVADQINDYREGLLDQFGGAFDTSMGALSDLATGEGLTDVAAAKEEGLGYLQEGMDFIKSSTGQAQDAIQQGQKDALAAISGNMDEAREGLKAARHQSMAAQAINAGRAAGEQSVQMASQMAAAGASPAQIVGAQIQADSTRGQSAAASIAASAAQYDTAISGTFQAQAQLESSAIQNMTGLFSQVTMQGAGMVAEQSQAMNQAVQVYTGMQQANDALRMQASTALANAAATGSNAMVNIISALPPTEVGVLGLLGELFSVAQTIHGAGYNTYMYPAGSQSGGPVNFPATVGY